MHLPAFHELRQSGAVPHYFGLGFIQLKLSGSVRLHFWVPEWPTIPGAEDELHNHRYAFSSRVLQGAVSQEIYALGPVSNSPFPGALELIEVSCKPATEDAPAVVGYAAPELRIRLETGQGQEYALTPADFHVARALPGTVTRVERGEVIQENAQVLRAPGSLFTCPFAIEKSTEECWAKIAAMVPG